MSIHASGHEAPRALSGRPSGDRAAEACPPALDSLTLLQGRRSVTILHNGEAYRLQATRQGKLILTK